MPVHSFPTYWRRVSSFWTLIGSPLRPSLEDTNLIEQAVKVASEYREGAGHSHTLLLGVTPEIAAINWPSGTYLVGADLEHGMISGVWPGNTSGRTAVCADWARLPFADGMFDFVVGDGCLALLDYPEGYRRLASSVRSCMTKDGKFMLRIFCRPEKAETLDEISDALERRSIGSFDAFKWRLAMAVQGEDAASGVRLSAVWQAWNSLAPDPEKFALTQGWPLQKVLVIDAYRDNPTRYCFPSLDEVRAVFGPLFKEVWHKTCQYELAERCPHVLFQPADD